MLDPVHQQIIDNHSHFRSKISSARKLYLHGDFLLAAEKIQAAALYAWENSTGLFASPEAESLLFAIAEQIGAPSPKLETPPQSSCNLRILHVLTGAYEAGGHTRLCWRWILMDDANQHNVALTQQNSVIPQQLVAAANKTGGNLFCPEKELSGNLIDRALKLRELASEHDLVILHIHPHDVVPLIAFSPQHFKGKLVFLNHAIHTFWLGVGISNLVVSALDNGSRICTTRRGIRKSQTATLSLPIKLPQDRLTRAAAKRQLSIADDSIVILTSGSPYKYNPIDDNDFRDLVKPALSKHPNSVLLVVGPEQSVYWQDLENFAPGRVFTKGYVGEDDLNVYYQAADIYVDSAPFLGGTSNLEAALIGVPVLSYTPREWRNVHLCFDFDRMPCELYSFNDKTAYRSRLDQLICSPALRDEIGNRLSIGANAYFNEHTWAEQLKHIYQASLKAEMKIPLAGWDSPAVTVLDEVLQRISNAKRHHSPTETAPSPMPVAADNDASPQPFQTKVLSPILLNPRLLSDQQRYAKANKLMTDGKLLEGADMLIQLAQENTVIAEVYHDLGVLAAQQGDNTAAKDLLQAAIEKSAQPSISCVRLAQIERQEGNFETALKTLSPYLRAYGNDVAALTLVREILAASGELSAVAWARLVADLRSAGQSESRQAT